MLDISRLRVLLAVAEHGSLTAAAKALHYAQPSVSHHLARLESETGAVLTQRIGRGIRLTPAGELLAERAAEIIGRLESAERELGAREGLRAGRIRLAAFPSAVGTFVPPALASFARAHPGVEVTLVEAEPPEATRLLRTGEADVAIAFRHAEPETGAPINAAADATDIADVMETPLVEDARYLVRPAAGGPEPAGPPDQLASYAKANWITGCLRCRTQLMADCRTAGFQPTITVTTDDYVAVQSLVAAGMGISTLPGLALAASRNPGVYVSRIDGSKRHVFAATFGGPPTPPGPLALIDELTSAATATKQGSQTQPSQ